MNRAILGATLAAAALLAGCAGPPGTASPAPSASIEFGSPEAMSGQLSMAPAAPPAAPVPAAPPDSTANGIPVAITDFAFAPATLTVRAGSTVTWTNHDDEPHTVVARDGSFHSPALATDAAYSFTFTTPGTFAYLCSIHPMMTATVEVTT